MNNRDDSDEPPTSTAQHPMGVERIVVPQEGAGALNGGAVAVAVAVAGEGEPPRKRAKPPDGAEAVRRRLLECELQRLRVLRDRFTDRLSELYFLQAGGNMMDYAAWRRSPPAPQLLAFLEARRPPPMPEPVPPPPPPAPALPPPPAPAPAPSAADEMVAAAKQEAYVAGRVAELARAGLWPERRLPRVLDPPRHKSHWDYLLEEMAWLAQDFAHERKWKKQAAKKCARAVQKHFQEKAAAALRAERAQDLQRRRLAAAAAREVRTFWNNVEKLVEWKRERRVERARKQALDEQLSYIVDRTERYSRQLAAGLRGVASPDTPDTPPSDDEFTPRGASSDDEESIAAAERDAARGPADHRAEIDALRRDSGRALADLLPPGYAPGDDYLPPPDPAAADDDEESIAAQERRHPAPDHAREIAHLHMDAHLSLEELRDKYERRERASSSSSSSGTESESESTSDEESSSSAGSLEALMADSQMETETEGGSQRVERFASLAASLQPTGTTLSSTAVGTPVPALLRHALREYQHVGLHWLATMHARRLNGILADEMGLGKTVQTIALLAHLALERRDWGPHLVVAPTSVVLNWEMEFKKWCPAFKILTYYGTIKERKLKRVGWTKANSFHVCITSYKLVVQDHQSFRRKRWSYLVLDEAQNIKNFKSQRWQLLLNFQTERRLLLTGTPLQNSLLELWSLMHFLMPDVFASHSEFREWFGEVGDIAEGARANDALVRRLHAVLRPFLLRRLKQDVERQMPSKHEHVLMCRLAKRQRALYDDFMSRAGTRASLASGNLLSVINVLMQLRKVCNHPDLFEPRPVTSPLQLRALRLRWPALALLAAVSERRELSARLGGDLPALETSHVHAFAAHRARHLAPPRRLVEELSPVAAGVSPPPAELRLHLRLVARAPALASALPPPPRLVVPRARPAPAPAPVPGREGRGAARLAARRAGSLRRLARCNERRCWRLPLYGADLREAVRVPAPDSPLPTRDLDQMLTDMHDVIDRFTVCVCACVAPPAALCVGAGGEGARAWRRASARLEGCARAPSPLARLHAALWPSVARQRTAFPHPRLLQYDCGKLQTLATLLRRLKAGGHRVLVFTQMTRVLDVLEAFLSMHGHAYLRLDGATPIGQRQTLVERFNKDARVFAFILSTRSGGVGLNLTGADAVVFYDSDWNPTMDAQAQDRCHRIGQTRDVHIYRLVTAGTVEENILRKADQKRRLNHLAIDDGHFTTSYLRGASIKELFGAEAEAEAEVGAAAETGGAEAGSLEAALAACEDAADAAAAACARAEARDDLAEFDETRPLEEEPAPAPRPDDALATDLAALMNQLTPIEKYAMRLVESSEAADAAERAALHHMRRQLNDWERARRHLRASPVAAPPAPAAAAEPPPSPSARLTYSRADASAKEWSCLTAAGDTELMPAWGPPTPPAADGDVYRESWAGALYRAGAAADGLLPPSARRDRARPSPRAPRLLPPPAPRAPHAPLSLFARAASVAPRQRARASAAPHAAPSPAAEWTAAEDAALRRALRLQRLPASPPPALAPNWEWCAELVGESARAYRSARACRDRHEALQDPERARRRRRHAAPRTAGARRLDHDPLQRLDAVRRAAERRRALPRRRPEDAPPARNPKHAAMLADHGVEYEAPPHPVEVASRRADRIAREKLKASAPPAALPAPVPPAPAPAAPPPRPARPPGPPVLYRQQTFPTRHLKILHQAPPHHHAQSATGGPSTAAAALEASAALRKLQLQQLALRRAAAAASSTPTPPIPTAPPAPSATSTAPPAPSAPDSSRQ